MRTFLLGALLLAAAAPAAAQTAALDPLVTATQTPAAGMALARRQIAAGDLLQALATLERLILADPANDRARLLHAGLLCKLDDRQGSLIEFDQLRGHNFTKAEWAEATASCGNKG